MTGPSGKKTKKPRAASEVARSDDRGLAGLLARAARLEQMDRALSSTLDPRYAPHVRVMNVRDGKLLLATPVAPIATRLRMEAPQLLAELQRAFPGEFTALEVVITPDLPSRN